MRTHVYGASRECDCRQVEESVKDRVPGYVVGETDPPSLDNFAGLTEMFPGTGFW